MAGWVWGGGSRGRWRARCGGLMGKREWGRTCVSRSGLEMLEKTERRERIGTTGHCGGGCKVEGESCFGVSGMSGDVVGGYLIDFAALLAEIEC